MPELRGEGPVRRRLRELLERIFGDRAAQSVLDALGREAGAQVLRAFLLPALGPEVQELPQALDRGARAAAAPGGEQGARVARRRGRQGARRLGYLARSALFRHPRAGYRRRKIPLRLARRADRLLR